MKNLDKHQKYKDEIMNQIKYYFTTTNDGNLAYHVDDIKENVTKKF